MTRDPYAAGRIGVGVLVAITCGLAAWTGLSYVAVPANARSRLAALETQATRIEQLSRTVRGGRSRTAIAVCPSVEDEDLDALRQAVFATASAQNLAPSNVALSAPEASPSTGKITPVLLRLQVEGDHQAVLGFLDRLAEGEPEIFVDRLDLSADPPNVSLRLNGKVFCWTSARH